jgi:hypothetical protein
MKSSWKPSARKKKTHTDADYGDIEAMPVLDEPGEETAPDTSDLYGYL